MVNENAWFPRKALHCISTNPTGAAPLYPCCLKNSLVRCHHEEYSQRKKDVTKASMQQIYNAEKCQLLRKWKKVAVAVLELSVGAKGRLASSLLQFCGAELGEKAS